MSSLLGYYSRALTRREWLPKEGEGAWHVANR